MNPACSIVDEIASRLAAQAGQAWDQLAEHPGYTRNIFREQARSMLAIVDAVPLAPGGAARQR